jgi:DNA-binding NarL/FixJ family response regulator
VKNRTRLLIVEDHPLVAQGLRALLTPRYDIVGIVRDPLRVLQTIGRAEPEVVLLDLSMPRRNGLELLPSIREAYPDVKVLIVTMHLDRALADMAFKAGAHGFVPKESTAVELRGAIEAVLRGEKFLSNRVPKRAYRDTEALGEPVLDRLTKRQVEILRLVAEGKNVAEIADVIGLSPRTVEFHRASIRRTLGITSEWNLVRWAILAGLATKPIAEVAATDPATADAVTEPDGAPS